MKVIAQDTISMLYGDDLVNSIIGRRNLSRKTTDYYVPFFAEHSEGYEIVPNGRGNQTYRIGRMYIPDYAKVGDILTVRCIVKCENITLSDPGTDPRGNLMDILTFGSNSAWSVQCVGTKSHYFTEPPYDGEFELVGSRVLTQAMLDEDYFIHALRLYYIATGTFRFKELKVEIGDTPSKWTPAPEDEEERLTSMETSITNNANEIRLRATQTDLTAMGNEMATIKEQTTTLSQNVNGWQFNWDKIINSTNADPTSHQDYITLIDGDIILGESSSSLKVKIANNSIQFKGTSEEEVLPDDDATAWITGQKLNINEGEIYKKLRLGKLVMTPRPNGNLAISIE